MRALYSLNIFFYGIIIRIASLLNTKAKLWIKGRKNLFSELEKKLSGNTQPIAWFHCASLGEFEQGRPLIERFRKENPDYKILLTFFSPSGYEIRKNYPGADIICYLPLDTPGNAKRFVQLVKPAIAVFVKYEFWLNHLSEISAAKIPHILVCAIFREEQVFFKGWGGMFRKALQDYSFIFTQEENSVRLLKSIGITKTEIAGDTRFDRVIEIADSAKEIPVAAAFSGESKNVLVAGSSWPADEELVFPAFAKQFAKGWKMIVAPHELGESHLVSIEKNFQNCGLKTEDVIRFSKAKTENISSAKVLLIDNIGMLSSLYRYGKIAYIGGGFGKSIHNILEAAVYGMPVIFGPAHKKFNEANAILKRGCGIAVYSGNDIEKAIDELIGNPEKLKTLSEDAYKFVQAEKGATEKILEKISGMINR